MPIKNKFKLKMQNYSRYSYMFLINNSDMTKLNKLNLNKFKIPFFYNSKAVFRSSLVYNKLNLQKSFFLYTNDINLLLLFEKVFLVCWNGYFINKIPSLFLLFQFYS